MIRVLSVDDSAVVRETMKQVFADVPGVALQTAPDVAVARSRLRQSRPDVLLLDLELPGESGLDLMRDGATVAGLPVVICSSVLPGSPAARAALGSGAVDFVHKPRFVAGRLDEETRRHIVHAVLAAAQARPAAPPRAPVTGAPLPPRPPRLVAIGISTGGPDALAALAPCLTASGPPIVVVQHMPAGFTAALAERLDEMSPARVVEARAGDVPRAGTVYIAPGGRHTRLHPAGHLEVFDGELVSRHRPSVDVLFESVAAELGGRAAGILMTGLGDDGVRGLLALRRAGGWTAAQDEATSTVYGMPRAAAEAGAAEAVLGLPDIAALLAAL